MRDTSSAHTDHSFQGQTRSRARVHPLPPALRYVLRIYGGETAELGHMGGFDLSGCINSVRAAGERLACRLGPDEWLLIEPEADTEARAPCHGTGSRAGHAFSLVEVSQRNLAAWKFPAPTRKGAERRHSAGPDGHRLPRWQRHAHGARQGRGGSGPPTAALAYRVECWRPMGPIPGLPGRRRARMLLTQP